MDNRKIDLNVLGFNEILIAAAERELDLVLTTVSLLDQQAKDRGISLAEPNDAADQSRLLIVMDAVVALATQAQSRTQDWVIVDNQLRIVLDGLNIDSIDWPPSV